MRYERHIMIQQIGLEGQNKLKQSKVVVVGAGGLASTVLTHLTCAGIGEILIIDYDTVSISNLNRQFLYNEEDIEKPKAYLAKEVLKRKNSEININTAVVKLDENNIKELIQGADVVIDCVDNVKTRLLVNYYCLQLDIPLVEGGVNGFYGFLTVVRREGPCLECMGYNNTKLKPPVPALGAVVGVIGSLQTVECIKILLGLKDDVLYGKMLNYDGLSGTLETIEIEMNQMCKAHNQ